MVDERKQHFRVSPSCSFVPPQFSFISIQHKEAPSVLFYVCHPLHHPSSCPLFVLSYSDEGEEAVVVGDGFGARRAWGLTMTWMTKSFWILVSCSRVLSVSSLPEKNQRWWAASMSSWACSCFFSCPMVSAMLALRRRSLPVDSRTYRGQGNTGPCLSSLSVPCTDITDKNRECLVSAWQFQIVFFPKLQWSDYGDMKIDFEVKKKKKINWKQHKTET